MQQNFQPLAGEDSPSKRLRVTNNALSYRGYELLGDSQLLRFSVKLLNQSAEARQPKVRRIGFCVSGQTIHDLLVLLKSQNIAILKKVILLIGTNDVTKNTGIDDFEEYAETLFGILKGHCTKIVLVSIPPAPRYQEGRTKTATLKIFNNLLRDYVDNKQVYLVDLYGALHDDNGQVRIECYEKLIGKRRTDLIHLNMQGFQVLKSVLDNDYFAKYAST